MSKTADPFFTPIKSKIGTKTTANLPKD